MAKSLEIPMVVEFVDEAPREDGRTRLRMKAVSTRVSTKRIRFTEAGLAAMVGTDPVPVVVGSHERGNQDVLSTIGFSENRTVENGWLSADFYLLQSNPKAQQLLACAQEDENFRNQLGGSICGTITDPESVRLCEDDDGPYVESDAWGRWNHLLLCPDYGAAIEGTSVEPVEGDWGEILVAATKGTVEGELDIAEADWARQKEIAVAFLFGGAEASDGPESLSGLRVLIVEEGAKSLKVRPGKSGYKGEAKRSAGAGTVTAAPEKSDYAVGLSVVWESSGSPTQLTKGAKTYTLVRPWDVLLSWPADGDPLAAAAVEATDGFLAAIEQLMEAPVETRTEIAPELIRLAESCGASTNQSAPEVEATDAGSGEPDEEATVMEDAGTIRRAVRWLLGADGAEVAQTTDAAEDGSAAETDTETSETEETTAVQGADLDSLVERIADRVVERLAADAPDEPSGDTPPETDPAEGEAEEGDAEEGEAEEDVPVDQTAAVAAMQVSLTAVEGQLAQLLERAPVSEQEPTSGSAGDKNEDTEDMLGIGAFVAPTLKAEGR